MPRAHSLQSCVDALLAQVGKDLRVAVPLAIGKPNALLNALYQRAKADPAISLQIYTALSLQRPRGKSELERRFLVPFVARAWGNYPDLDYETDRERGELPPNVRVLEFYFYAGKYLANPGAQRDYISTNYTYVARDLALRGINVIAQEVCRGQIDGATRLSLSSNADVSLDLVRRLRAAGEEVVLIGQLNAQLPFMHGEALLDEADFDVLIEDPALDHTLFGTPKTAVTDAELAIGLHASALVRDGGSLQIGIGAIGDALVYALKLRHERNADYLRALDALSIRARFSKEIAAIGGTAPFERGLFAPTEMLVDGFMHLIEAGIVKREVYDDEPLQRWVNEHAGEPAPSLAALDALCEAGALPRLLDANALRYLQHWGLLRAEVRWSGTALAMPDGSDVAPDLRDARTRAALQAQGLGARLRHGKIVHAAFFLGPQPFYGWLRSLPDALRRRIDMRSVTQINQLYGGEALRRLQRRDARFINTGMMATLFGAVVSDGLDNGKVVSGVGGQYNFVAMAHELEGARSILQVRATRPLRGETISNVVYDYGHATIPRHQRDVLVTEYGIADLRARTDREVVAATLAVTDASAQAALVARAEKEGKLEPDFQIAELHQHNRPQRYTDAFSSLRKQGLFPALPFGTELTELEVELGRALRALGERMGSVTGEIAALTSAATAGAPDEDVRAALERMGLSEPKGVEETLYARLVSAELRRQRESS